MTGRVSDPNSRRLKRFILLVMFAITLPSLMLCGFGLIAINNERDATRQRVLELYKPVLKKLRKHVQFHLRGIETQIRRPFESLVAWGVRERPQPVEEIGTFFENHDSLTNFFVIHQDGMVLLPRKTTPFPSWNGYLPTSHLHGLKLEFKKNDPALAVAFYRSTLGELDGKSVRCNVLKTMHRNLSGPELEESIRCREADPGSRPLRCLARNALARSLDRSFRAHEAIAEWGRFVDSCPRFVDRTGYNMTLGARLRRLELLWPMSSDMALAEVAQLAKALSDPLYPASLDQKIFVAKRTASILSRSKQPKAVALRGIFILSGSNYELLSASQDLSGFTEKEGIEWRTVFTDETTRVLVVNRTKEGILVGAELVDSVVEQKMQRFLEESESGSNLVVRINSNLEPFSLADAGVYAGSVLLSFGRSGWRMDLFLKGSQVLDDLAQNRARLYLWALIMLAVVLGGGIAGTVWVMARETRLSRLKTDFVSSVSHELRTPLTSIRLFTETLLLGRAQSEEEQKEFLQIIAQESERLSRLVERILDFSRMEAGRKAYSFDLVDAADLVNMAVMACGSLFEEKKIKINKRLPDDAFSVCVNKDAIVEVFINLLSNAIKYSPEETEVTVSAKRNKHSMEISVSDRGIGIARSEQGKIFEKFYRVETPLASEVAGSGLGLSLVKYIVHGHGGEIVVDSAPGRGSVFTVRLPMEPVETRRIK
jgi:signal transduction histidine kinase